ncbi:MAG TPA: MFS transporter [Bryobacteraceae bacterium]|nr:MFS transporter [Bryobacteraceae bacterium]
MSTLASPLVPSDADHASRAAPTTRESDSRFAVAGALGFFVALNITFAVANFNLSSLMTPIKHDLAILDAQFGRIEACHAVSALLGLLFFGYLGNRLRLKSLIVAGVVVFSLATVSAGLAGGFFTFLLAYALQAFGGGVIRGLVPVWLGDLVSPKWRMLIFGIFNGSYKIGTSISAYFGAWLAETHGWRATLWWSGLPGLAILLAFFFLREPTRGQSEGLKPQALQRQTLRDSMRLLRLPNYLLHLAGLAAFSGGTIGLVWVASHFQRAFGITNREASAVVGFALLCGVPAGFLGGFLGSWLLRHHRHGYGLLLSVGTLVAAAGFFFSFQAHELASAKLFLTVAICSFGACTGATTTVTLEIVPIPLRLSAVAVAGVVQATLGTALASEMIGILSDRFGLARAILLVPALFLAASSAWTLLSLRQWRSEGVASGSSQ